MTRRKNSICMMCFWAVSFYSCASSEHIVHDSHIENTYVDTTHVVVKDTQVVEVTKEVEVFKNVYKDVVIKHIVYDTMGRIHSESFITDKSTSSEVENIDSNSVSTNVHVMDSSRLVTDSISSDNHVVVKSRKHGICWCSAFIVMFIVGCVMYYYSSKK